MKARVHEKMCRAACAGHCSNLGACSLLLFDFQRSAQAVDADRSSTTAQRFPSLPHMPLNLHKPNPLKKTPDSQAHYVQLGGTRPGIYRHAEYVEHGGSCTRLTLTTQKVAPQSVVVATLHLFRSW